MNGIIITLEKDELRDMMQNAVELALTSLGLKADVVEDDNMTVDEVAAWLRLEKSQIYQKTHYKTIPFRKRGKRIYFSRRELNEWMVGGRVFTKNERMSIADDKLMNLHKSKIT